MVSRPSLKPVRPALLLGAWVLVTYGFRLVTAIRARTWDSVTASVILLGLSAVVAVLAWRLRAGRAQPLLGPTVRVLAGLAAAWSIFRLVTVWAGTWSAAFRTVHTVICGVLLILAVWSWLAVRSLVAAGGGASTRSGPVTQPN